MGAVRTGARQSAAAAAAAPPQEIARGVAAVCPRPCDVPENDWHACTHTYAQARSRAGVKGLFRHRARCRCRCCRRRRRPGARRCARTARVPAARSLRFGTCGGVSWGRVWRAGGLWPPRVQEAWRTQRAARGVWPRVCARGPAPATAQHVACRARRRVLVSRVGQPTCPWDVDGLQSKSGEFTALCRAGRPHTAAGAVLGVLSMMAATRDAV